MVPFEMRALGFSSIVLMTSSLPVSTSASVTLSLRFLRMAMTS